ncbi:MAG: AgmX/PglI C-terminal domain-containing protein [Bacteroidota bacterium]
MKFVCERCHTKYSIADEKVRGKVLKVRCKTCANVITVRETGATIDDGAAVGPREAAISRSGSFDAGDQNTVVAPRAGRLSEAAALPVAALFAPASPVAAPPARTKRPTPRPPADNVEWYLAVDGAQTGPFPRSRLLDKILSTPKDADVHVWNADLDAWKPPKDVPEIESDLARRRRSPTPVPPPPLRRSSIAAVPLAATSDHHSAAVAATAGGAMGLDLGEEVSKHPAAGHKKNGFAGSAVDAAAAAGAGAGAGEGSLARFGLDDLLGDGEAGLTPPPAAARAAVAALGGTHAEPVVMLTPPPVAAQASSAVAAGAAAAAGPAKGKQLKLVLAALAVVLVLCGIVLVWMFRRPPATTAAVEAPASRPTTTDFAGMAEKLAREEEKPPLAVAPPPPPPVVEQKPVIARVEPPPQKGGKGKPKRKGALTTPPPLGAGVTLTAEQREAANRFGESTGRDVRLPSQGGPAARSTPAQADISRVINNNRQGIQTCYQRALLRDNTLTHGKVTVRVSIGLSGKVKSVNLDAPSQFRALEPCIRDVMSRWAFPPSSEEYGTEFPVVLQGNQ